MPITRFNKEPAKYNAIKWTGDNIDEIKAALNTNLFNVNVGIFNKLAVDEARTNARVVTVPVNSWIVSDGYWGPDTDQFGVNFLVYSEEEFNLRFFPAT